MKKRRVGKGREERRRKRGKEKKGSDEREGSQS